MPLLCGVDLIYVPGIARVLANEASLRKFFHGKELNNTKPEHLAGVLAAKEAFFKALGVVPKFLDVQIGYEPGGRPRLIAAPVWQTYSSCDVSISHDGNYAIAMVILQ